MCYDCINIIYYRSGGIEIKVILEHHLIMEEYGRELVVSTDSTKGHHAIPICVI